MPFGDENSDLLLHWGEMLSNGSVREFLMGKGGNSIQVAQNQYNSVLFRINLYALVSI